jgi:hypothetical protein
MIVMPANATGAKVGYVARQYEQSPARLGHLNSPGSRKGPYPFLPYALDNGAFPAWSNGIAWQPDPWLELLDWSASSGQKPLWCLVPDVVGDRERTLEGWRQWSPRAAAYGWPLAFAAQDGMTPADVPSEASVVFLGGTTEWKWSHLTEWCMAFPRVHVGRVNGIRGLRLCAAAGAESCDGTYYSRKSHQWNQLLHFLAEQAGERPIDAQASLSFAPSDVETESGSRW